MSRPTFQSLTEKVFITRALIRTHPPICQGWCRTHAAEQLWATPGVCVCQRERESEILCPPCTMFVCYLYVCIFFFIHILTNPTCTHIHTWCVCVHTCMHACMCVYFLYIYVYPLYASHYIVKLRLRCKLWAVMFKLRQHDTHIHDTNEHCSGWLTTLYLPSIH